MVQPFSIFFPWQLFPHSPFMIRGISFTQPVFIYFPKMFSLSRSFFPGNPHPPFMIAGILSLHPFLFTFRRCSAFLDHFFLAILTSIYDCRNSFTQPGFIISQQFVQPFSIFFPWQLFPHSPFMIRGICFTQPVLIYFPKIFSLSRSFFQAILTLHL